MLTGIKNKAAMQNAALVFLAFLGLLTLAYLPLMTSGFLFHDDFSAVLWNKLYINDHPNTINCLVQSRFGEYLIVPLLHYWLTAHTAHYLFFVGVILLGIFTSLNFYWLRLLQYPPVASFTLAAVIATLPPFQNSVFNVTCEYITISFILAQLAAIYALRAIHRPSLVTLFWGMVFLLGAQFTYTVGGCYFLVFLLLYLLSPEAPLDRRLIGNCFQLFKFFFVGMLVFYAGARLNSSVHYYPMISPSGRGYSLNTHVCGQIHFYLTYVLPKAVNLWRINSTRFPQSVLSKSITGIFLCCCVLGAWELLRSKIVPVPEDRKKLLMVALLIVLFIIPATIAPPLMSVPGRWVPYRLMGPHMAAFFMLAFWGVVFAGTKTFSAFQNVMMRQYASLALISFSLVYCSFMLERYMVRPMNFEHSFIQSKLSVIKPSDGVVTIALRRDPNRDSFIKEGSFDGDGWGASTTNFSDMWGVALITSLLREQKIEYCGNRSNAPNAWSRPCENIVILSPGQNPPPGSLLIDMHDLFTLSSGL